MKKLSIFPLTYALLSTVTLSSCASAMQGLATITPTLETRSHYSDEAGRHTDVDDPAIWIHPTDKSRSLVVTTLKKGGIDVYNLAGELLQFIEPAAAPACKNNSQPCKNKAGRLNNADIIYGFKLGNELVDLVVISDRGLDKLAIYTISNKKDGTQLLSDVTASSAPLIFATNQQEINEGLTAYGLATAKTDKAMAFVSQNSTTSVVQLELFDQGNGQINYKNIANLDFPATFTLPNNTQWTPCADDDGEYPHLEGMVADTTNNALFLAQEDVGIWKINLADPASSKQWQLFAKVKDFGIPYTRTWDAEEEEYLCELQHDKDLGYGSKQLIADAEGLTLYDAGNGKGYLLASSQGNNTIAVYERDVNNAFVNSFTIGDGAIDGVNETDGMMVVNANLGGKFDQGVLIMQDGDNQPPAGSTLNTSRASTNFKYVSWRDVASKLKLDINTQDLSRK